MSRAFKHWTEEEIITMHRMLGDGCSHEEIGDKIDRSFQAVRNKRFRPFKKIKRPSVKCRAGFGDAEKAFYDGHKYV